MRNKFLKNFIISFSLSAFMACCSQHVPRTMRKEGAIKAFIAPSLASGSKRSPACQFLGTILFVTTYILLGGPCDAIGTPNAEFTSPDLLNDIYAESPLNHTSPLFEQPASFSRLLLTVPPLNPSSQPFIPPSSSPSEAPYFITTENVPSSSPSLAPSIAPTLGPTRTPSRPPTKRPTRGVIRFTFGPTPSPSALPSSFPSSIPSFVPSRVPTMLPSALPSLLPSVLPSVLPSHIPTQVPTALPTQVPISVPTNALSFNVSQNASLTDEDPSSSQEGISTQELAVYIGVPCLVVLLGGGVGVWYYKKKCKNSLGIDAIETQVTVLSSTHELKTRTNYS